MYNCSKCSFNSEFEFSVATHEKWDHPLSLRKDPFHCYTSYIGKRLCPEWDYDTHFKVDLDNHVRREHQWKRKEFVEDIEIIENLCDNCSFKTYSKFLWMLHVHDKILLILDVKNVYVGNEKDVPKKFSTEIEAPSTKTFKLFYCYNCSFKSKYKGSLKKHILVKHMHTSNELKGTLKCDRCSFKTYHKCVLKWHKICKHTTEDQIKWFKCEQCTYKGKQSVQLTLHIKRKHSSKDDKIHFKCDHCPYKTRMKQDLKMHKYLMHTPDDLIRWFKCEKCSYKTKRSANLAKHIKRKHSSKDNENDFKCDHCPYKTHMKENLKMHEYYMHTPDDQIKWFKCEQCSYKGKQSNHLIKHIQRVHSSK